MTATAKIPPAFRVTEIRNCLANALDSLIALAKDADTDEVMSEIGAVRAAIMETDRRVDELADAMSDEDTGNAWHLGDMDGAKFERENF